MLQLTYSDIQSICENTQNTGIVHHLQLGKMEGINRYLYNYLAFLNAFFQVLFIKSFRVEKYFQPLKSDNEYMR